MTDPNTPDNCPFCGGAAKILTVGNKGYWRTSCKNVVTCGHAGAPLPSQLDSIEAWNRRADGQSQGTFVGAINWRCFHCNFIARSQDEAIAHFGSVMNERPAVCLTTAFGILDSHCKYLAPPPGLCSKCGRQHDGGSTITQLASKPDAPSVRAALMRLADAYAHESKNYGVALAQKPGQTRTERARMLEARENVAAAIASSTSPDRDAPAESVFHSTTPFVAPQTVRQPAPVASTQQGEPEFEMRTRPVGAEVRHWSNWIGCKRPTISGIREIKDGIEIEYRVAAHAQQGEQQP